MRGKGFRTSFFWRVYGTLALLILAATALVGFLGDRWMVGEMRREIENSLQVQARLLGVLAQPYFDDAPGTPAVTDLQGRVRQLGAQVRTRLTAVTVGGRVLADSEIDPASLPDEAARAEFAAARSSGLGIATGYSAGGGGRMLYVAIPVYDRGEIVGFARAAVETGRIEQRRVLIHRQAIFAALVAQAIVLLVGFLIERRITKPLLTITQAADTLAGGDYRHHHEASSNDEIASLARSLNEIAQDVRDRLEQSGRERSELLATLDEVTEGVVVVDRDEKMTQMNSAAGTILRADPGPSIGRPIWEVIRHTKVTEIVAAALNERAETARMVGVPSAAGEIVVDMRSAPLHGEDGMVTGAILVFQDVTELTRLERMRRDFTANVTHELKTPLTALRGLVETLREDPEMKPTIRADFVARISDQTTRLTRLVDDLLTLTRVESSARTREMGAIDLREPIRDAVGTLRAAGEKKGLSIAEVLSAKPVAVAGDRAALRQVGENLLDNAIKYTNAGGRIDVRVFAEGDNAVLEVEDTGIGIELDEQGRIFERFYRVDRARVRAQERDGAGLGLAIVKRITLALGGDVSVRSRRGQGSVFSIRLPLVDAARGHTPR